MTFRTAVSDGIVTALGYAVTVRRVDVDGPSVKINLGSGLNVAPGWINVDASLNAVIAHLPRAAQRLAYPLSGAHHERTVTDYVDALSSNRFVFHDLRRGLPFADACADFIYTSHVLEHLERGHAKRLMTEARRVIKPGGVVRVVVPDLRHLVELYVKGDAEAAVDGLYAADVPGSLGRHRHMYDEQSLARLLCAAGFVDIARCAFQEGATPDLGMLDSRPDESLYVEARR